MYTIYTDGAYSPNYGGGIGYVVFKDGEVIKRGSKHYPLEEKPTNQRMEQMAAILALESIEESSEVTIVSDSAYVVKTYTAGWKRKANWDLWELLDKAIAKHTKVSFEWVKGHATDTGNMMADYLAQQASKNI